MKALSLTQPWASAVALGLKRYETRSWPTGFRGDVCIHAAKGFPRWARDFAQAINDPLRRGFQSSNGHLPSVEKMPLGVILCVAELTECRQTDTLVNEISDLEQLYGNYSDGRYAFRLENVRVLPEPIPVRGALSFWTIPLDIEERIKHTHF
jgi:hypothetical protein